jgi:hypothetical protein
VPISDDRHTLEIHLGADHAPAPALGAKMSRRSIGEGGLEYAFPETPSVVRLPPRALAAAATPG